MVREKSGKSQGILLYSKCGHPVNVSVLMNPGPNFMIGNLVKYLIFGFFS